MPHYVTVMAGRGSVAPVVVSSGAVNPVTTIQVGTYVSGVIESVLCDFNTQVKAGQLCARIDPRPYQTVAEQEAAALGMARAQLAKDRSSLDYAQGIDARNASLLQRGIVSQETADTSHSAWLQARAQVALDAASVTQHAAQLKAARINLGYTNIVSPVDGTVVSRNVTQGQTVAASFQTPTLFLIATDLMQMQVDTNVSESDIGRIAAGNGVTFSVAAYPERLFSGVVRQVRQAPQTVQNVVTYDVVVSVPNGDLALKPGMTAAMRIVTSRADHVLRVPGQALRYRPTTPAAQPQGSGAAPRAGNAAAAPQQAAGPGARAGQVWILADGKPRRLPVAIGLEDDAYAQIVGGPLREGDAVIVSERADAARRGPAAPIGLPPPGR
ncbi:efflux RND transporter periplasmic adaptor subunit [Janthinobacterium sp.]|uniref:efflux RND transporter periplasmic adaptor subunit n=1 Tax=Janthinobacterium sp. TaxID=1871054 RepID=UPI002DB7680B|nr:efflux RND transporter periplasmic adaptor subunit [Janthinobacterium sp.]HEU4818457.1 efflux RND transporter periplasmic adaptor subunit [Janthinobacterium sp.]